MLEEVKDVFDITKRNLVINEVKKRICGSLSARTICCPAGNEFKGKKGKLSKLFWDLLHSLSFIILVKLGNFSTLAYGVSGEAFALGFNRILIKTFIYKGGAPAAYFVGGASGKPDKENVDVVLPYPYKGRHYSHEDDNIPALTQEFTGQEDIILFLPPGTSVAQLGWIAVHCREYNVDFGHVIFPSSFSHKNLWECRKANILTDPS
jgi:hypothetical protein